MPCPRCQHESPSGQKFCGECGARLATPCSACGASNPPDQKFCGECGTALTGVATSQKFGAPETYTPKHLAEKILTSKSALEGERKQVTVLFADLKGSMELLADRDPEEARQVLDPVLEHMMEAVHRYEGTVNQVMGGGIMALFGAPLAHEDEAPGKDRSQQTAKPNREAATVTGRLWPDREETMATEFTVILEDRPGTLARLGIVLGDAMVNIEGIHGTSREKRAIVQFVTNDQRKATRALNAAGIAHSTREVLIVRALDEPGTLGDVALVMSQAGINIDSVYVTTRGYVVLGVDDLAGATQVAGGMAVMTPE